MAFLTKLVGFIASPVSGIAGALVDVGKSAFNGYMQGQVDKRKIAAAVADNKIRLAQSEQTHNQAWEMAQLEDKDRFLRRLSFILSSAPMIVAIVEPEAVQNYFNVVLASMPQWYINTYMVIIGAIWGVSEFKKWKR